MGLDVPLGASVPDEGADDLIGVVALVDAGFVEAFAAGVGGVSAFFGSSVGRAKPTKEAILSSR